MVAANATVAAAESIYEDLTDDKKQSVGEVIANATIDAGLSALFTYVGYSPSAGKSLNAMYSAKKAAKKQMRDNILHPSVKVNAKKAIKKYNYAFCRFVKQEGIGIFGSGFVDNSKKALSYTFKEITKAIIGW